MVSSVSLSGVNFQGSHVKGKREAREKVGLTPNGNTYIKTNGWAKVGGGLGAVAGIALAGFGGGEKYLCNADKIAAQIFKGDTMFRVFGAIAVASGIVSLASTIGHGLFKIFDNRINKKRAQKVDEKVNLVQQENIRKALEAEKASSAQKIKTDNNNN